MLGKNIQNSINRPEILDLDILKQDEEILQEHVKHQGLNQVPSELNNLENNGTTEETIKVVKSRGYNHNLLANILIIILGISVGILLFSVFYSYRLAQERQSLIRDAQTLYANGKYSRSLELFEKAKSKGIETDLVNLFLGRIYTIKRDYTKAISFYSLVSKDAYEGEDLTKLGEAFYNKGDYRGLVDLWSSEVEKLDAIGRFILADSYYNLDKLEEYYIVLEPIKDYREVAKIYSLKDFNYKSFNLESLNSLKEFTQLSNYPLVNEKFNWSAFDEKIKVSINEQKNGNLEYANLIKISAYKELNLCKFLKAELEQLSMTLRKAGFPAGEISFHQGGCLNQMGNPNEAIPYLKEAISLEPTNLAYRLELANSYFLAGDKNNLLLSFEDLSEVTESEANNYILVGYLYDMKEYDQALEVITAQLNQENLDEAVKNYLAYQEIRINLLEKGNLKICEDDLKIKGLSAFQPESVYDLYEQSIILGHCDILTLGEARILGISLLEEYFVNLAAKNKQGVLDVLDQVNFGGILTKYYREIGLELL